MKLIHLLFILLCWMPLAAEKYTYNLAVGAIFQDEAPYLKEWIEYYRIQGVDHFWLYNNESEDNYLDVLQPYVDEGIVDIIDWPTTPFTNFHVCQMSSYTDCLTNSIGVAKWLAIIDCDEFIVPVSAKSIPDFLKNYEKFAGIRINWQMYGTSFQPFIPEDKTMLETLVLRAPWDYKENELIKLIVRPERILRLNLHSALPKTNFAVTWPGGKALKNKSIVVDEIRINHYWTRAEDYFLNYKIPRALRIRHTAYPPEEIERIFTVFNLVEDRIMDKYVPELRERLGLPQDN